MNNQKLTRRHLLRLAALSAASSLVAACETGAPQEAASVPTSQATPQASAATATIVLTTIAPTSAPTAPPVPLALGGTDADVWAWTRQVNGTLPADCADPTLTVGDAKIVLSPSGESFTAQAALAEGTNALRVVCRNGAGQEQRSNVRTLTVPLKRRPTAAIQITIADNTIVLDGITSRPFGDSDMGLADYTWSSRENNPAPLALQPEAGKGGAPNTQRVSTPVPTADGEYYVSLRVTDAEGHEDISTSYFVVTDGKPRVPDYDKENTVWVDQAIVYGVIPRKFGDPGFNAVTEKLDYLKDLGINALWFSPITRSPAGDFGYAVVDYFDVNPDFGTKDDFKKLVQEAHARGIRVLMDFVPNHTSDEHPYFVDAKMHGKESSYYDFYDRDASGTPTHYFDWENLPNLNFNNPEVERFITEGFSYWVREFDVDGFRTDACWGVKERKPDYWPRWRRELKRIKPDLLLLAEASARDSYYFDNGFDAAYDWTAALGKWAWELVWDSKTLLTYNLNSALTNNNNGFHPDALIFRFLNNNDTGTRFITDHGEPMTRVATALLLTLPGIPCVYTGDEIGAWYRPYYDELPLVWDENKYPGLRDYYKKLIALRLSTPALHARSWQPLDAKPSKQLYSYLRYTDSNASPVLVILNFSDADAEAEITLPEAFAAFGQNSTLHDLLSDETVTTNGATPLKVAIGAWGARVLVAA